MTEPLLRVRDLKTYFGRGPGTVRAVDGVSFDIAPGEVMGLVGESGSGKTATGLSILRLIPQPPGRYVGGEILFGEQDLLKLKERGMRKIRGNRIAMIFQDPMTSLNPYLTVGRQLTEVAEWHRRMPAREAFRAAVRMLERVGIADAERRMRQYPHEFSGGMRQRVMVAMALLLEPALLIADEPTTALDVTTQAQVLAILGDLRRETGLSILLITHDLGVVAGLADRVAVMYAGKIVEEGKAEELLVFPKHPYTQGLLKSRPRMDGPRQERLDAIPGSPPDLSACPPGCAFHPRCGCAAEKCARSVPEPVSFSADHWSACFEARSL